MVAGCTANVVAKPDPSSIIIQAPVGAGIWVKNGKLIKDWPVYYKNGDKLIPGIADILVGAPMQIGSLK